MANKRQRKKNKKSKELQGRNLQHREALNRTTAGPMKNKKDYKRKKKHKEDHRSES